MKIALFFRVLGCLGLFQLGGLDLLPSAQAGSATWKATPVSGSWGDPNNWTPATVPNTTADIATFDSSNTTSVNGAGNLGGIIFQAGASAYTVTFTTPLAFDMAGVGVTNNSGILQEFIVPTPPVPGGGSENILSFRNSATAGTLTQFTVSATFDDKTNGGEVNFYDNSTAGSSAIIVDAGYGTGGGGGNVFFADSASAGSAVFTNNGGPWDTGFSQAHISFTGSSTAASATLTNGGGTFSGGLGGSILLYDQASADAATIVNNGGTVAGAVGAVTSFAGSAKAASATIIANSGVGSPGTIVFSAAATGDSASVKLFGGALDISGHDSSGMTLGSLEGDGPIYLGSRRLTVGRNRVSTTYSGLIQDGGISGGTGGSFAKVGLGALVLTHANTYTGDTSINGGTLTVSNTSGSGTGTGPVQVNAGLLGGRGTIAGSVNVGTNTPDRPHLAPASGGSTPAILTIQGSLTFQSSGGYNWSIRTKGRRTTSDSVKANGVTIIAGATFTVLPQIQGTLQTGTVFTVITNTSASAISGTFSNLADGAIVNVNGNNLQASYSGGSGNDLTLTVVP